MKGSFLARAGLGLSGVLLGAVCGVVAGAVSLTSDGPGVAEAKAAPRTSTGKKRGGTGMSLMTETGRVANVQSRGVRAPRPQEERQTRGGVTPAYRNSGLRLTEM